MDRTRAGDQNQNIQIQEAGRTVEGVQRLNGLLAHQAEGVHGAGAQAGEQHTAAEPGVPYGDVVANPTKQSTDGQREGQSAHHIRQQPVHSGHENHDDINNDEHPNREAENLVFF